jgi:hypothetical protein
MRILAEIPHPIMRITVLSWNEKYQIRFEVDRFEQVYKVAHEDIELPQAVNLAKRMADGSLKAMVEMRSEFQNQWK